MTRHSADTVNRERAPTNLQAGIPQTILLFILKRLEARRPGETQQQGNLQ